MVRVREQRERRPRAESSGKSLHELQIRELVTRPLEEQHRSLHRGQVRSALVRRFPGGMQRKSKKRQAANIR